MEKEQIKNSCEVPFFARFLEGQQRENDDGTKAERTTKYPSDSDEIDLPWL